MYLHTAFFFSTYHNKNPSMEDIMKYFIPVLGIFLLFSPLVAEQSQQSLDLKFKSLSYINESLPTLSVDLSSEELSEFDFIIAYANNYFEQTKPFSLEENREHIYLGFNYRF